MPLHALNPKELARIRRRVAARQLVDAGKRHAIRLASAIALASLLLLVSSKPAVFDSWGEQIAYAITHTSPGP